jgi:hypothetical protein
MNNQETNQTGNQPETVASVTNDQSTIVAPTVPTVPDTVKLELTAEETEMIQELLNDYVYAYRSDREVDYKRELVRRDKVGKYPYVAEPADPSIINPVYDWVNQKWYSKNGTQSLPVIAKSVADLNKKSIEQDQAALANGQQMQMITEQLGAQSKQSQQILQVMNQLQKAVAILAKGNQAETTAQTQPTTDTETTNGGNN